MPTLSTLEQLQRLSALTGKALYSCQACGQVFLDMSERARSGARHELCTECSGQRLRQREVQRAWWARKTPEERKALYWKNKNRQRIRILSDEEVASKRAMLSRHGESAA
ncbi:MAG TPA: hypothetical protein VLH56_00190 [Dissulfurispiraceae bacterium]|nr:hypothetical protein [Dissulfurispiraceae bacterium]